MKTRPNLFLSRTMLVAGVFGIGVLGNLRSQAQEAPLASDLGLRVANGLQVDAFPTVSSIATSGNDVDGAPDGDVASGSRDDGQLVPAIYAWDPDVRFVYYRHVSKWM